MKNRFWVILLVLILLVTFVGVRSASAWFSCPSWLTIPGICTSDQGQVQVENVTVPETYELLINYDWAPDRSLVTASVTVPDLPVILGLMNFNKYRLEIASIFVSQEPGYNSLHFIGHLECDSQGSLQPTVAFSIPRLMYPPNSTFFGIDNWEEAITTPCKY